MTKNELAQIIQTGGQTELSSIKLADAIFDIVREQQTGYLATKEDVANVKTEVQAVRTKVETVRTEVETVRTEVKSLELRLVQKYNLNTMIVGAMVVASAASQYFLLRH